MQLGLLYKAGILVLASADVYFCPGDLRGSLEQEAYQPWPSSGYSDRIRTGYYYNPHTYTEASGNRLYKYKRAAQFPADKTIFMDVLNLQDLDNLDEYTGHYSMFGWNTARSDGSIRMGRPARGDMLAIGTNWTDNQSWSDFSDALKLLE